MHDPREPHLAALKWVLRYVRGTLDYGLQLRVSSTSQLNAYTDVDWAGCLVTLSHSSAEPEYRGVANVVAETDWIRILLRELHTPLFTATLVYCDNVEYFIGWLGKALNDMLSNKGLFWDLVIHVHIKCLDLKLIYTLYFGHGTKLQDNLLWGAAWLSIERKKLRIGGAG
ncbi:ribonuclease H-like domain-containing protein [Tanacetum coccineum]|uniref:Ribonuclease H-like domain-containing protein n=1 Tax=Tanacetum coccineum TaxID=301880 RepID=A0ABQ5HQ70_9ASTR